MRMHFSRIFAETDGCLIPRFHINIGDVAIAAGVPVSGKLVVGGLKLGKLTDCDLAVEVVGGLIDIQGFYRDETAEGKVANNNG